MYKCIYIICINSKKIAGFVLELRDLPKKRWGMKPLIMWI